MMKFLMMVSVFATLLLVGCNCWSSKGSCEAKPCPDTAKKCVTATSDTKAACKGKTSNCADGSCGVLIVEEEVVEATATPAAKK